MKKVFLTACLIALTAGCKKKAPVQEPVPVPKTEAGEVSGAAPASTAAVNAGGMLQAPGNYVRTVVGQVDKAKAAKALFEKTAAEQSGQQNLNDNGGN